MKIITPKQIIKTGQRWESSCPRVPFPSRFLGNCLFTMYLDLFIAFLFSYQIFVILTVWGTIVFLFYYYLVCGLFRTLRLSRLKTHIFLLFNTTATIAAALFMKGFLVKLIF